MRFSEPVRMSDDGDHSPVWARSKRRRGNPFISLVMVLLAPFVVRWVAGPLDRAKTLAQR